MEDNIERIESGRVDESDRLVEIAKLFHWSNTTTNLETETIPKITFWGIYY